jgi:hypothetical protein
MVLKIKLKTSTSFRALSIGLGIYILALKLSCKNPTHTTLLNWVHKIGYYELNKKKEVADDWVILLDESIQLGQDKILAVFGIRKKNIDFSRPLKFQDLVPLREIVKYKWNGEIIKDEINDLREELGSIKYAVGDYGGAIRKGLKLLKIPHIHDLTHKIALILEKLYKNNKSYNEVIKNMSEMRVKYAQSKIAEIIPPKQRKKSRYQNIKKISDWCYKSIMYIENCKDINCEIYEKLKWVLNYKSFITELSRINKTISNIEKILKHNGLSNKTVDECSMLLEKLGFESGQVLKDKIIEYFSETKKLLPKCKKILISSDIIESAFGKYKNYVSQNPMAGVTNLILCISAFTASLTKKEIKKALENTTINDVKEWTKNYIGKTLLQKRRQLLSYG